MACKWNGLFNVGEDFDDEDLLQADWDVAAEPVTVTTPAVPVMKTSCLLRAPAAQAAVSQQVRQSSSHKTTSCGALEKNTDSGSLAPRVVKQTSGLALGISGFISSAPTYRSSSSLHAKILDGSMVLEPPSNSESLQCSPTRSDVQHRADLPKDDFDDFDDLDFEDLDENAPQLQTGLPPKETASAPPCKDSVSPAKRMRESLCAGEKLYARDVQALRSMDQPVCQPASALHHKPSFTTTGLSRCSAPVSNTLQPQVKVVYGGPSTPTPVRQPPLRPPPPWQKAQPAVMPQGHPAGAALGFLSPVPTARTGGTGTPALTSRPLNTPVFTNHLMQLVSAANKTPQKPRSEQTRPKTRRFPGPAGLLPQQLSGRHMEEIVVSLPQTPAHGAVARLRGEVPSSQVSEEEEFSVGPWAMMKAEMGLDERNPACFLHSYSVVMVLRKAALKQLARNKVPNMAVMVKALQHTHADAKAVFRDPTGEMQGTVHRRLLEDRQGELKTGAVLLLKQVGVFSPSHRNHYLNVTPNNLLRLYPPEGTAPLPSQQSHHAPEQTNPPLAWSSPAPGGAACQMELTYEDEEADGDLRPEDNLQKAVSSGSGVEVHAQITPPGASGLEEPTWEADDLDELLGELPVGSYGL